MCLDGKWGYINYQGEEVIPLVFDKAYYFQENFALVHIGGTGGAAWSGSLEYVDSVAAARRINHGYTFINKEGDRITSVCYDEAGSFNEGLARVEYDGKCGFIDYSGKEIIPLIYDETSYFAEGKTKVSLNGREFYIDKNGNEISE